MARLRHMVRVALVVTGALTGVLAFLTGCELSEELDNARKRIENDLKGNGIYDRGNMPYPPPTEQQLKGYYDVIGGAYRHIVNEDRPTRGRSPEIQDGQKISFYFEAKVYSGSFANSRTYFTNIADVMATMSKSGEPFTGWSTAPLEITLSNDSKILKAVQVALIGCRADTNGSADDNDLENGTQSDNVRIYVPYDIGFGNNWVYNVPPKSTLVFEITRIRIL